MSPPPNNDRTELLLGRQMTDAQAQAETAWADERARKVEALVRLGQTIVKTAGLTAVVVIASPAREVIAAVVAALAK